jgi:hypothetical protein
MLLQVKVRVQPLPSVPSRSSGNIIFSEFTYLVPQRWVTNSCWLPYIWFPQSQRSITNLNHVQFVQVWFGSTYGSNINSIGYSAVYVCSFGSNAFLSPPCAQFIQWRNSSYRNKLKWYRLLQLNQVQVVNQRLSRSEIVEHTAFHLPCAGSSRSLEYKWSVLLV